LADDVPWSLETFTASDGYRWHYRRYPAVGASRAHVVCVHGIQSHAGWYSYSCEQLARAGYTLSFLDRRGSGRNLTARGDAPSFRRLLDDIAEFLAQLRAPDSQLRTFLFAISWGGKLAVALQKRHPGLVDGIVLLCPGFRSLVKPTWAERWAILRARLTQPDRLFPVPLSDPALFTATPHWQQFLREDPLAVHQATARFLVESVRLDGYLRWARRHVRVPVLLLLAEKDRIIDNVRTRTFVERFPTTDREAITYPDAHHTLEFEPEPDRFIDDVLQWFGRHESARSPSDHSSTRRGTK
jgi:alpha-beta hydrolase superfamily lysophospholipase